MLPFVGRRRELEALRLYNRSQMYMPLFVYGPEGCGKSRLFREAVRQFREWYPDGEAIYVNALARVREDVFDSSTSDLSAELVSALLALVGQAPIADPIGRLAARLYHSLTRKAFRRAARLFVVVDEIEQSLGLGEVSAEAKYMSQIMNPAFREETLRNKIVNFSALTSEGESRAVLARHSYAWFAYVWNLSRGDFEEFYYRVREAFPSPAPPFEEAWRLYGGNPRRLEELAHLHWDVEGHLRWLAVSKRIPEIAEELRRGGWPRSPGAWSRTPTILGMGRRQGRWT